MAENFSTAFQPLAVEINRAVEFNRFNRTSTAGSHYRSLC
jgi:hypothetical protein